MKAWISCITYTSVAIDVISTVAIDTWCACALVNLWVWKVTTNYIYKFLYAILGYTCSQVQNSKLLITRSTICSSKSCRAQARETPEVR